MPTIDGVQVDSTTYNVGGDVTFEEIAQITGPSAALPISYGGTGADDANGARTNLSAVGFADATQGITTGTLNASDDKTYTATDDCVVYFLWQAQANSSLTLQLWINGTQFINYSSGGAVNLTASIVPFFLKKGDTLRMAQSNNRTCAYSVFKLG